MVTISNTGNPHKARRPKRCIHCKEHDHDQDKMLGNTHRFHEASGLCPYYRTHKKKFKRPKFYSKCVTPSGISQAHSRGRKHKSSLRSNRSMEKKNKPPKYSLWQDVKAYGRKKRSS